MSLIIEDKNALDILANAIIRANGAVDKTSVTKGELTEIINNIIPLKTKFASGVFTPSENITTQNSPRINFALGNDEQGIPNKPNVVIAYQPYALTEKTLIDASCYLIYTYTYGVSIVNPIVYPKYYLWKYCLYRKSETTTTAYTGALQSGATVTDTEDDSYLFNRNGFKLVATKDEYPFLAGHPIVWLQIKF